MPDPLASLRKDYHTYPNVNNKTNDRLSQKINNHALYLHSNNNRPEDSKLKEIVTDLVNFLAYIAKPTKNNRQSLGK